VNTKRYFLFVINLITLTTGYSKSGRRLNKRAQRALERSPESEDL